MRAVWRPRQDVRIVTSQLQGTDIHVILDNLSTHKAKRMTRFLADQPNLTLHFTPTYSSWLNQIELWFSKIQRDMIARGVFTSVTDLRRKLMRYIRKYNDEPKPIRWGYTDATKRIRPTIGSSVTVH
jgi:transposase